MKILFMVADLFGPPGGIARYAQMVCRTLLSAGYSVDAVVLTDALNADTPRNFNDMAFNYHPCGDSRRTFVRMCSKIAVQRKPALILVGHINFSLLAYGLAQLSRAKWATFIYGIDVWQPLPWHRRFAAQRADQIIAISQFTAQKAAKSNGLNKKGDIQILHNCLSPSFKFKAPSRSDPLNMVLLTVARMTLVEQYKGHDYVIRAMPALRHRFPNLVYHIVGDGDWQPTLERLASELGVSKQVVFHGRVSDKQLRQHYADASVFIMPSQKEGFGFVFIEAMAQGLPAIGGNWDATPEVIVDGETGYIVNPTSVEEIITAVSQLLEDAQLREQMGIAAQQLVKQEFSFERFQQCLLSYLCELK